MIGRAALAARFCPVYEDNTPVAYRSWTNELTMCIIMETRRDIYEIVQTAIAPAH